MGIQNCVMQDMKTFLGSRYYIPDYQREYAWEENEIGDFWDDLEVTMRANEGEHFFGQIVVHNAENTEHKKYIIDGQQRTLTSMIFLCALHYSYMKLAEQASEESLHNKCMKMVWFLPYSFLGEVDEDAASAHIILNRIDNDFFVRHILLGAPSQEKERKHSWENMRYAYQYFAQHIEERLKTCATGEDGYRLLKHYQETFLQQFKVMYMEATRLEEAFVIFETLNARGKELETADLLKNFIFSKVNDIEQAQKHWNTMLADLDNMDSTRYIRYFWNACHSVTREKELYRVISKELSPRTAQKMSKHLADLAACYHDMANPESNNFFSDKRLVARLSGLKTLKAKTFYPVVLAMELTKRFTEDDMADVLAVIESYTFRNTTVCGLTANRTETMLAHVAKQIYDETLMDVAAITAEIRKTMVKDDAFAEAFVRWSSKSKDIIRYILRKINQYLDPDLEINIDNSDVHIEHIMPENGEQWENISKEDHDEYLWRLGNMTLLSGKKNRTASNKVFEKKAPAYLASKIQITINVAKDYKEWSIEKIEERQKAMCACALKIWR